MRSSNESRVQAAVDLVNSFVPEFKLAPKSKSLLHRSIGRLLGLIGNPDYMNQFWTTLHYTAAYPDTQKDGFDEQAWTVVLHEGMHAIQRKRGSSFGVNLRYAMPQLLALPWAALCFLAVCLGFWSWWLLLGFAVLAPLPSCGRSKIELEAYRVSVAVDNWWWGGIPPQNLNSYVDGWLVPNFVGPAYYWMFPFRGTVRSWFVEDGRLKDIQMTDYLSSCKELALKHHEEDNS